MVAPRLSAFIVMRHNLDADDPASKGFGGFFTINHNLLQHHKNCLHAMRFASTPSDSISTSSEFASQPFDVASAPAGSARIAPGDLNSLGKFQRVPNVFEQRRNLFQHLPHLFQNHKHVFQRHQHLASTPPIAAPTPSSFWFPHQHVRRNSQNVDNRTRNNNLIQRHGNLSPRRDMCLNTIRFRLNIMRSCLTTIRSYPNTNAICSNRTRLLELPHNVSARSKCVCTSKGLRKTPVSKLACDSQTSRIMSEIETRIDMTDFLVHG